MDATTEPMAEVAVKDAVRERDGFACCECGATQESSLNKSGKSLDVHRILPGLAYREQICATLCRPCHAKKATTVEEAISSGEVVVFAFNDYLENDRSTLARLLQWASDKGLTLPRLQAMPPGKFTHQLSLRVPDEVRTAIEESAKLLGMEPNDFLRMYLVKHTDDMRRLAKEMAAAFNK